MYYAARIIIEHTHESYGSCHIDDAHAVLENHKAYSISEQCRTSVERLTNQNRRMLCNAASMMGVTRRCIRFASALVPAARNNCISRKTRGIRAIRAERRCGSAHVFHVDSAERGQVELHALGAGGKLHQVVENGLRRLLSAQFFQAFCVYRVS